MRQQHLVQTSAKLLFVLVAKFKRKKKTILSGDKISGNWPQCFGQRRFEKGDGDGYKQQPLAILTTNPLRKFRRETLTHVAACNKAI